MVMADTMNAMDGTMTTTAAAVEGADAGGTNDGQLLVGSKRVVYEQRRHGRRSVAAVQAALDAIGGRENDVDETELEADVRRVKDRGGLVAKSLEKVACDERLWDRFLKGQPLKKGVKFPAVEKVVAFGAWMTRTRQRACLAQRDGRGPERKGQGRHTARCVLTQLSDHVWSRRYLAFAQLPKAKRAAYWSDVLEQFDGLHKAVLGGGADEVDAERGEQLLQQTAPVTERKHFYRTEVHQLQVRA